MDTVFKQSIPQNVIGGRERSIEIPAIVTSLTLVLIITSLSYFIFQQETLKWMAQEDGIVENLSALNWMLAGLLMLALFSHQRNVWLLLLGILFLVCFGEELSWGQRVFGFSTPEWIQAKNYQGEFNLHNLNFFERRHGNKGFWGAMLDTSRIFSIFWFTYGIVLPILVKLSPKVKKFVRRIHLPVMPLTIGLFFLINYMVFQYFEDYHAMVCARCGWPNNANCSSLPVEIREWFESLLFLVFSIVVFAHRRELAGTTFDKCDGALSDTHPAG